jgi:hypothetical protein
MIQGLSSHLRSLYKDLQVIDQLGLAGKILDGRRTNIILKLLI